MLKESPVALLICGDLGLEKHEGFWVQDCSAATVKVDASHAVLANRTNNEFDPASWWKPERS
jgi:hypothetical protein